MQQVTYAGWEHCYRLANDQIEAIVTADVGPRIIRFGFIGEGNEFGEYTAWLGKTGGTDWRNYGGHRLWHAPEVNPRTTAPDNDPVIVEEHGTWARFIQPVEPSTGIQKEMDIRIAPQAARIEVLHRLRNHNLWAVELAPWALSVMATGGVAVIPLPARGSHTEKLLPQSTLALWAYTDMADPRWTWGTRYVLLRQDSQAHTPQKAGFAVPDGWAAYARAGHLFVITFAHTPQATYPDMGSNVETFTDAQMLEIETLGPLTRLEPGATVEHVEQWHLFRNTPVPQTDSDVVTHILPHVQVALSARS